jgi:hypothetical protein
MLFFNLKVVKEKPTFFLGIMSHLKLSKNMLSDKKKMKKKKKNSYGLLKIWSNFNHSKNP